MASFKDEGVCVRHWDWSETSQTVSLLCREMGLIRGLAKGARRPAGAFSGGIELLCRGEVLGIRKPTSDLATLTAWDLRQTFPILRRSLAAHYAGLAMAGVSCVAIGADDPHPLLYDALVDGLAALEALEPIDSVMVRFLWSSLVESGHRPEFQRFVDSDSELPSEASYAFSPARGGIVSHVPTMSGGTHAGNPGLGIWRVRAQTVRLLCNLDEHGADASPFSDETWSRAANLLASYARRALDREIPALDTIYPDHTAARNRRRSS